MIPIKDDNPSSSFPFVTVFMIAVNVGVFIYTLTLKGYSAEAFLYKTAVIPYDITHIAFFKLEKAFYSQLTLITSLFVHAGFIHIIGNMLFLWIFGDNVEDTFGHIWFALFYIGSGLAATFTHIFLSPDSTVPLVGASGAIAGVLGAYFILFPKAKVHTLVLIFLFIRVVKLPAVLFLSLWFVIQILSSTASDGVAWFAHIGGFLAGMLAALFYKRYRKRRGYAPKFRSKEA